MDWEKNSWRNFRALQQPNYQDKEKLNKITNRISSLPPLVFAGEVRSLKKELARAARGESFLLQGGDCAESFNNFNAVNIRDMFKVLLQMAIILTFHGGKSVVKVGRVAGQFAKPRSNEFQSLNGKTLPSYRGDIINGFEFDEKSRIHDPERMLKAYYQSASTLNLLRAFSRGGLANLKNIHSWNIGFIKKAKINQKFDKLVSELSKALEFMEACGLNTAKIPSLNEVKFYTSHEALLLPYEEALTRVDSLSGEYYDCSAHMLWIGDRTRGVDEAHVHFLSGVKNPIGVKISSKAKLEELLNLAKILNPTNEEGRLNFIVRMGANNIEEVLPNLLNGVKKEGLNVLWSVDPMHGNTFETKSGFKTREFDKIISEVKSFFEIHKSYGTIAGGVHLEMTGANVTECMGGSLNLKEEELSKRYETMCDPRLNADQALELAFTLVDLVKKNKI